MITILESTVIWNSFIYMAFYCNSVFTWMFKKVNKHAKITNFILSLMTQLP